MATCKRCNGMCVVFGEQWATTTGAEHPDDPHITTPCPDCKGTGEVSDEPEGDPERKHCIIGCEPECTVCHRTKKPVGRDSRTNDRCSGECPGYWEPPSPCDLWPGEWRDGRRDDDSDEGPADSKTSEEGGDADGDVQA